MISKSEIKIKNNIECQKVGNDWILFLAETKQIASLNSTASFIFELIMNETNYENIKKAFVEYYSEKTEREEIVLIKDLVDTIEKLKDANIIEY